MRRRKKKPLEGEVLDARGAARLLGLSVNFVTKLAKEGRIPAKKLGRVWRFSRRAVVAWLSEGEPSRPEDASWLKPLLASGKATIK